MANENDALSRADRQVLSMTLNESEGLLDELDNAMAQLDLLQNSCDSLVALHSIELAIKVC